MNTQLSDWKIADGELPIGLVSSFGMSGTNAQVLVQDYRPPRPGPALSESQTFLLVLSAKSQSSLRANATVLANALEKHADLARNLTGVSHTLSVGRAHFRHRCALVVGHAEDAVLMLRKIASGQMEGLTVGWWSGTSNRTALSLNRWRTSAQPSRLSTRQIWGRRSELWGNSRASTVSGIQMPLTLTHRERRACTCRVTCLHGPSTGRKLTDPPACLSGGNSQRH